MIICHFHHGEGLGKHLRSMGYCFGLYLFCCGTKVFFQIVFVVLGLQSFRPPSVHLSLLFVLVTAQKKILMLIYEVGTQCLA